MSPNLLSLPNEILLLILEYVFTGAKVIVQSPEELTLTRSKKHKTILQRIKDVLRLWAPSKSLKPDIIIPLQPPLSILQTNKNLATMSQPVFWKTVIFDLTDLSVHDLTSEETISHHGIPLDKFQQIMLITISIPDDFSLFKSLEYLRVGNKNVIIIATPSSISEPLPKWSHVATEPWILD